MAGRLLRWVGFPLMLTASQQLRDTLALVKAMLRTRTFHEHSGTGQMPLAVGRCTPAGNSPLSFEVFLFNLRSQTDCQRKARLTGFPIAIESKSFRRRAFLLEQSSPRRALVVHLCPAIFFADAMP